MSTDRRTRGPRPFHRPPKHGARALARHLAAGTLDKRTGIARDFYALQDALAEERGGWANTSTGEKVLMEVIASELIIVRALFAWAARQPSIIEQNGDGPRLLGPLAKGFTSHAAALTRAVQTLGLHPDKVERLPSLQDYLASKTQNATTTTTAPSAEGDDDAP